jgi:hypothetical protein
MKSTRHRRSGCPINFALKTFGDMWSLLFLIGAIAVFAACNTGRPSGASPVCANISRQINNDQQQIHSLSLQKASAQSSAVKVQLDQQIAAKQRDITTQQQQAKIHGCP